MNQGKFPAILFKFQSYSNGRNSIQISKTELNRLNFLTNQKKKVLSWMYVMEGPSVVRSDIFRLRRSDSVHNTCFVQRTLLPCIYQHCKKFVCQL